MSKKFSAILTAQGAERLAAAAVKGIPLGITHMAVGDGGGVLPVPSPDQTALINEQYRAPLNRLVIADQAANVIRAEMIMPPQAGASGYARPHSLTRPASAWRWRTCPNPTSRFWRKGRDVFR
jgi:phage-related tail fiber protein